MSDFPGLRQIPLPLALVIPRLCLAPVLLATALLHPNRTVFAICLIGALLSDYFEGVIARRPGVATAGLRRLDSITARSSTPAHSWWH